MTTHLYKAGERGTANHGWLQANFSFSFGNYFNADNMQFGMLRVLNDDTVSGGSGFGTHPHDNMEIITIPLEGGLKHRDSMGNEGVIGFGEVQVMSAGTGILHSEMNASHSDRAKTLQIWVFPDKQNVTPRYGQKSFDLESNLNKLVTIVTPENKNDGQALWVHQQTFFSLGIFEAEKAVTYRVQIPGNGIYAFLIEGGAEIEGHKLSQRDALGVTDTAEIEISFNQISKMLLIEVPMDQ